MRPILTLTAAWGQEFLESVCMPLPWPSSSASRGENLRIFKEGPFLSSSTGYEVFARCNGKVHLLIIGKIVREVCEPRGCARVAGLDI